MAYHFLFLENHKFIHHEIENARNAEREQVANDDIPFGEVLYQHQHPHFDEKGACARNVVSRIMAEERFFRLLADSVFPGEIIAHQKIGEHGTFKRDERRNDDLSHIVTEHMMREHPQDQRVDQSANQVAYEILRYTLQYQFLDINHACVSDQFLNSIWHLER
jgi:hypothetical protein